MAAMEGENGTGNVVMEKRVHSHGNTNGKRGIMYYIEMERFVVQIGEKC